MSTQSEQTLENNLIQQLVSQGYEKVTIQDEAELIANLKTQLEKHNEVSLSVAEFEKVLNHLNKGNVFERAQTLRDKMNLMRDDGSTLYLEFLDQIEWCQNQYQVIQQVTVMGKYENRYDVTILINGLPLVQIELKRRGIELKEAFNQINRYQRHSYGAGHGLFRYVQLFVISNGVNTKYYANNIKGEKKGSFKQTFFWADENNNVITQLEQFTKTFLEKCHLSKMIAKYIVLNQTNKILMVLRPYQFYATEAIIDRVKNSVHNGYIWHTTGSGKTLTSFKTSQILMQLPQVHKVVFVVDRKDLDYQTTKEFNSFSKGSVDGTDNTKNLVQQFSDDTKLIVTTIQKLNTAITKTRYTDMMDKQKDKKIIFIFDECHRSQFGDTHKRITEYFQNYQMFGFTGTPIFADNVTGNKHGKRTTKDLFGECLHKYVITDAIKDENVLKFSIEYIRTFKKHDHIQDIEVEDIDTKEVMESSQRLSAIADYIIANHDRKTHAREFTGMFCVSSTDILVQYYDILQAKKEAGEHDLKIATIYSFGANEEDPNADGLMDDEVNMSVESLPKDKREKLEGYIEDFNKMFTTSHSLKDSQAFYNYYNDVAKKVKERQVDILLVVNMFLTGFDSKTLNTLYVDKNLKYHGLIQAYSRTNRILNEKKSQGNIVCFRNLKEATDKAIGLFSDISARDTIIIEPYESYVRKFNQAFAQLLGIAPTVQSVDDLQSEDDEAKFVQAFRELMRLKNVLATFTDFSFDDLAMTEQGFTDYQSKYLDLYDKVRSDNQKEKVSILNDIDFELELIHRDEINVAYILQLLGQAVDKDNEEEAKKQTDTILELIAGDAQMRSKKDLIEKFIQENLPEIQNSDAISEAFTNFWTEEKTRAFEQLCEAQGLETDKVNKMIDSYLFTEREPSRDDVVDAMLSKPKLLKRKTLAQQALDKIMGFVNTFIHDAPE